MSLGIFIANDSSALGMIRRFLVHQAIGMVTALWLRFESVMVSRRVRSRSSSPSADLVNFRISSGPSWKSHAAYYRGVLGTATCFISSQVGQRSRQLTLTCSQG